MGPEKELLCGSILHIVSNGLSCIYDDISKHSHE
jgi:hypothetical protein